MIVSSRWVHESIEKGLLQNKANYIIRGSNLGQWNKTEKYRHFKYQIGDGLFKDMTIEEVRELLTAIGGEESLSGCDAIKICADNEVLSSGSCVHKEWIFQCITDGMILPTDFFYLNKEDNYVSGSDTESSVVTFKELTDKPQITVQRVKSKSGKFVAKKLCCVYCENLTSKLYRHLENKHGNEIDVARALSYPCKSNERRKAWAALAARGMAVHNEKVKMKGSGIIIPKYRPRKSKQKQEYLPCEFCRAEFISTVLWKHHKACPLEPDFMKSDAPVKNSRLLLPVTVQCSNEFKSNILKNMRDDIITCKVKGDPLIIQFGERKFEKIGKHHHTHQYISENMRSFGRLMIAVAETDIHVTKLQQCLISRNWELLLKAVKKVAEYDISTSTFRKPTLAQKLGHYIKKCAKIVLINARKNEDSEMKERIQDFLETYQADWTERIGCKAYESKSEAKYNKVQMIPLAEDVKKLTEYISEEIQMTALSREDDNFKHNKLAQLCLAQVILYNRKRAGEVQRLKTNTYREASVADAPVDEDVKRCMSKFEQFLCRNHSRIETRGKKGRKVAILLTKTMKANIDQLISLKNEETEYLFQLPGAKFPLRGADVLRRFTSEAALKHPKSVTSTSLRKQLATMSQVLNLDNNDQDILARFTGHDLNVHRDFDRLPQSTLEVAKVSKVLHALNIGSLDSIKGKNFDDIDAEGDLEYEPASDEDDDNIVEPTDGVVENDNSDREDVFSEYSDDSEADASCKKPIGKRRKISQKTPWSKEEQDIVFSEFKKCFTLNVLPKKLECEQLIKKHPVLTRRTWTMVKGFVRTRQLAMKRQNHAIEINNS